MPDWMNHKLESTLPGETSTTSDIQTIPTLTAENEKELKNPLVRVKQESEKAGLKLNIKKKKSKIVASIPITSWQIDGDNVEIDFIFLGSKITVDVDYSHKIKDACFSEEKLGKT